MRTPKPERIPDYLAHILDAIDRIESYVADVDETEFYSAHMLQDAVIRNFEIIGEASRRIMQSDPEYPERYPHLSLREAYGMRNWLAHGYEDVILEIVWKTLHERLPRLKQSIEEHQRSYD